MRMNGVRERSLRIVGMMVVGSGGLVLWMLLVLLLQRLEMVLRLGVRMLLLMLLRRYCVRLMGMMITATGIMVSNRSDDGIVVIELHRMR